MYADDFDSMEFDAYGDDFSSTGWGQSNDYGSSNSLGPAGDEDFSINERRRKMVVGITVAIVAVIGAILMLYAFASGMA